MSSSTGKTEAEMFLSEDHRRRYYETYDRCLASWEVDHERFELESDFGWTQVIAAGEGASKPLVLIHGAGVSSTMWGPNIAALSRQHRVYALDIIGDINRSRPTNKPASHEESAQWLESVFAGLGLERAALVGHSYGGFLCANLAIRRPQLVERLALLAPAATLDAFSWRFFVMAIGMVIIPFRPRPLYRAILKKSFAHEPDERFLEQIVEGYKSVRFTKVSLNKVPPIVLTDEELGKIVAPALLIYGDQEIFVKSVDAAMERFRTLVPQGRAELVADAGHMLTLDRPQQVDEMLLDFLDTPRPA
jgi:pimeloyl-ACP methyl ester carboxylesterase